MTRHADTLSDFSTDAYMLYRLKNALGPLLASIAGMFISQDTEELLANVAMIVDEDNMRHALAAAECRAAMADTGGDVPF